MDLYTSVRCLYALIIWIMYVRETKSTKSPRWIRHILHSTKLQHRTKRFDFGIKAEQQTPEKYLKNCCKNGGLCVMGSFCQCKKEFYGRYCQYEVKTSNCGPVQHKQWFRSDCCLCVCHNGKTTCLEGSYKNCSPKVFSKDFKPADPSNIIKIFPLDPGLNHMENSWADPVPIGSGRMLHPEIFLVITSTLYFSIGIV